MLRFDNSNPKPGSHAGPRRANSAESTILLVDDEENIRELTRMHLMLDGFSVRCADGADAAFSQAKAADEKFDLLITDLSMPGMSGDRFIPLFKRLYPATRVLVMSGQDPARELSQTTQSQIDGFISKPFTYKELSEKIHAIL